VVPHSPFVRSAPRRAPQFPTFTAAKNTKRTPRYKPAKSRPVVRRSVSSTKAATSPARRHGRGVGSAYSSVVRRAAQVGGRRSRLRRLLPTCQISYAQKASHKERRGHAAHEEQTGCSDPRSQNRSQSAAPAPGQEKHDRSVASSNDAVKGVHVACVASSYLVQPAAPCWGRAVKRGCVRFVCFHRRFSPDIHRAATVSSALSDYDVLHIVTIGEERQTCFDSFVVPDSSGPRPDTGNAVTTNRTSFTGIPLTAPIRIQVQVAYRFAAAGGALAVLSGPVKLLLLSCSLLLSFTFS